jgi:uncharacterized membrane protein
MLSFALYIASALSYAVIAASVLIALITIALTPRILAAAKQERRNKAYFEYCMWQIKLNKMK